MKEKHLNLIYNVGKGSMSAPVLIDMLYEGDPHNKHQIISLVGKGITFDSGGVNLKP